VELERFLPKPEKSVTITVSVGVTEFLKKEQISTFIQRADQAMYDAKAKGRNRSSALFAEEASNKDNNV
jgi:diguanylate cyclase (GGDEF)-like protein